MKCSSLKFSGQIYCPSCPGVKLTPSGILLWAGRGPTHPIAPKAANFLALFITIEDKQITFGTSWKTCKWPSFIKHCKHV